MTTLLEEPARTVAAELERLGVDNDARETDRSRKMLNLETPSAELLFLLLRASGRRRVLEIGTSNGYSAVWIAAALQAHRGHLWTVERDAAKLAQARTNLESAGLAGEVTFIHAGATEAARDLAGPFDAVFFDADRVSAPEQLALLMPKLDPDALLVCDNVLSHPEEVKGYLAACERLPGFTGTTLRLGKGLHVAHRAAER